ncbi:2-dehydropantoate 2-reductase [Streptomyces coryli]|uniref:2-dehydropantoate 2-reductase n=1 Tax=Streptomyces coryli TaxID=1128680 RepID=UPI0019D0172F
MPTVAIIGAGAIGTVFGAAAEEAGADVVVCVRTPVDGLVLDAFGAERPLSVRVTADPGEVRPVDWVLLTTKVQDTESARPWLAALCGPGTVVVAAQNGVGHRERVQPLVPAARVVPALVYVNAERLAPGRVLHRGGKGLVLPAGPEARALAGLLAATWLEVTEEADFTTAAWRKLLSNAAANPVTALTGRRLGVLKEPEVREVAAALLAEAVAVGAAEGAKVGPEDVGATLEFYGNYPDQAGTSMLSDRLAMRPLEHEYISGTVTRLGRRHGIPTPVTQAVYALLGALEPASP